MLRTPIIIVGMARSGTTLVSHILGKLWNVHVEVEPHALWRTGNFKYLNDEEFDIKDKIVDNIKTKLTKNLNGKTLIEKSPINSLRATLVHAVFPEAKIVYVERDPVRCIYSNYVRSIAKDSYKLSIIFKKYFIYTGSEDLSGAISDRKLFEQISISDIPDFLQYNLKMLYLRQVKKLLPFGPKLRNFPALVAQNGLLWYHTEVYRRAQEYKRIFKHLYQDQMQVFQMEDIMYKKEAVRKMIDFTQISYTEEWLNNIIKTFDAERIHQAVKPKKEDTEIIRLL